MKKRKEYDSIGAINVNADKYWGASTERSNKFFNIGKILVDSSIIRSIAIINYRSEDFSFENTFNCGEAKIKINKPMWLQN